MMETKSVKVNMILLVVIAVLLTANLVITSIILSRSTGKVLCPAKSKSLPCEAMPIKFALDNPDCANKLLRAMNVTNVKVLPRNSTNLLIQKARAQFQNYSMG